MADFHRIRREAQKPEWPKEITLRLSHGRCFICQQLILIGQQAIWDGPGTGSIRHIEHCLRKRTPVRRYDYEPTDHPWHPDWDYDRFHGNW